MSAEAVAIFFDENELDQLVEGWPEGMRLAVCLDADGGCAMVVHHGAEDGPEGNVLRRVGEALNRPAGDFAVVPARPGLPTRRMMFSEERMLMRLVTDSAELVEFATDYALNYAFAAEEGLDVEAVMTGRARPRARSARPAPATKPEPAPRPEAAAPPPRAPTPAPMPEPAAESPAPAPQATPDPVLHPRLPDGFRALAPEEQDHSLFTDAVLSLGGPGRVRLTTAEGGPDDPGVEVREIYFRDDLLSFAIPVRALAECDHLPEKIVLSETLLPRAMVSALARGPQAVRLTATGAHLFVGLAPARSAPALPGAAGKMRATRTAKTRSKPRRSLAGRILRGGIGGGALAAGLLLALQIGLSPAFSHTDAKTPQPSLRDRIFDRTGQ